MSFEWYVPPEIAFVVPMQAHIRRVHQGIVGIAERRAPQITAWMKANHLWENRTGDAEAGLQTAVEDMAGSMVRIIMAHGADVEYGIWLEVANSGRFAIIAPAVDHWAAVVWADVQRMMRS